MTDLTLKHFVHQPENRKHVLAEPKYHDAEKLGHFLCSDSVPHGPFCACSDFRGNWRNLTLFGKQLAWKLMKLQRPCWFTKPDLVTMWTKDKWFLLRNARENLGSVHVSGFQRCLQNQLQDVLCTILRWCLLPDLSILFLASTSFDNFLFDIWCHLLIVCVSSHLLEWIEENYHVGVLVIFFQIERWKHSLHRNIHQYCDECKEQVSNKWPQDLRSTCSFKFIFKFCF